MRRSLFKGFANKDAFHINMEFELLLAATSTEKLNFIIQTVRNCGLLKMPVRLSLANTCKIIAKHTHSLLICLKLKGTLYVSKCWGCESKNKREK